MAGLSAPAGPVVPGAAPVLPILTKAAPDRYEVAQRRSLFDILFGNRNPPPETAPAPAPKQVQRPPAAPASRPAPLVVEAVKNEGATRLAVIGDSLAVDLARALGRFYADDPDLEIVGMGVGSSGLVRSDFYDWETAISEAISADQFDLVVVIVGINDRQEILLSDGGRAAPLTEPWRQEYQRRLKRIFRQLQGAGKPAIWVGLPPMRAPAYSAAIAQISSIQRAASSAAGAEFVDIYERFVDENGGFTANGPDLNGQAARMRKGDGIHFATAGSDKVAFFVDKAVRLFYRGGALSVAVADPLAGTDAQGLQRPPFQGLGQARLLEIAGAVLSLNEPSRAFGELAGAGGNTDGAIDLARMMAAPVGRADAFGVGVDPSADTGPDTGPEADLAAMQGPMMPGSIVQALSIEALIEAGGQTSGF
ncbi:MAG: DUF459 domain-containing protein [Alphaproteobacteria bacterium]|nr:DUF459 domain-containing protein [Alphaproteobacteria bacterium]